jgi:hypothetical protein
MIREYFAVPVNGELANARAAGASARGAGNCP